ncbi:Smr/MutS family protein [candidate division KSB1 bacterium]|nr:Smr/MutS family protein [candidate division KSB1 bacterium]
MNIWTRLFQLLHRSAKTSASSTDDDIHHDDNNELPEFIEVTDVLDLHGTPVKLIPDMIDAFLQNAIELKLERVQIIHGKGRSKLKYTTYQLIKNDARVFRFYDAPPQLGGWGRTVIELKPDDKDG